MFAVSALPPQNPILVNAPVTQMFQPAGFDDNDNVEVILHGVFPSSCYKVGPVAVSFGKDKREILLDARAYRYSDDTCVQMQVPFIVPVQLGTLTGGDYVIKVVNAPANLQSALRIVSVTSTSPAPDDVNYASVDSVGAREESNGMLEQVVISGRHPFLFVGCMTIKNVRVQQQTDNTIVLLPATEILSNEECAQQKIQRRYQTTVALPKPLSKGTYLFHVRTVSGTSTNQLEIVP